MSGSFLAAAEMNQEHFRGNNHIKMLHEIQEAIVWHLIQQDRRFFFYHNKMLRYGKCQFHTDYSSPFLSPHSYPFSPFNLHPAICADCLQSVLLGIKQLWTDNEIISAGISTTRTLFHVILCTS